MPRCTPFVCLLCLSLAAQESSKDDLQALLLNTRLSGAASKRVQALEAAPADTTVLTGAELEALGYRTLGDALGGILGFQESSDRAYQYLGVRGVQVLGDFNTRVLILLDGHTLNSPAEVGSSKVGEDFGIPMERISRIEVVRGPASSLYGSNAFLGMVNVVTKDISHGAHAVEGAVTAGTGGLKDAWLHCEQKIGSVGFSFTGTSLSRSGMETQIPELRSEPFASNLDREYRQSAYVRVWSDAGIPWSVAAYAMSRQQHLPTAPFGTTIGDDAMLYRNRQQFFEARVNPKFGAWDGFLRVFGDYSQYSDVLPNDGIRSPDSFGIQQDIDPDHSLGFEAQLRRALGNAWFFTVGTEQRWHRFNGRLVGEDLYIPTSADYQIRNVYVQAEFAPTSTFQLVAGLQRSAHSMVDSGNFPRFAAVWQPAKGTTLKLLSSQGLRQPTIFERAYDDGYEYQANPALKPERIFTNQMIWIQDWLPGLQTQLSYMEYRWNQLIQVEAITDEMSHFANAPEAVKGRACEVETRWQRGPFELYAQGGYYQATSGGGNIDNLARTLGGLRAIYRISNFSVAAEWRHISARSLSQEDLQVPAADVLRCSLRYDQPHFWIQLSAEDLFNARRQDFIAQDYDLVKSLTSDGRLLRATVGMRF